jgi:hypothetical protein
LTLTRIRGECAVEAPFLFFFLLFGRGGLIPSARSRAPRWHCTRAGEAARGSLDHETAHDVCCLLIRLGVKATTSFRCLLPRFPPRSHCSRISTLHTTHIYYSSAQAQGSVHISTSAAVAALQPCQQENLFCLISIPKSLEYQFVTESKTL